MAFAASLDFALPSPLPLLDRLMSMLPVAQESPAPLRNGHAATAELFSDSHEDDRALVARALNGDGRAFERLIRRHYDMIHRVAWRQTGLVQEAEDIVQNVLMQLVEKLASYRGEARFTTWLIGITINACHDHRRRRSSFGRMREAFSSFAGIGTAAPDGRDLIRQSWLRSQLVGLLPELRATVVLVAGEGLSHREAAVELGISENTVSWRMSQVRKQLSGEGGRHGAASRVREIRDER